MATRRKAKYAPPLGRFVNMPIEAGKDFWRGFARSARQVGKKRTVRKRR